LQAVKKGFRDEPVLEVGHSLSLRKVWPSEGKLEFFTRSIGLVQRGERRRVRKGEEFFRNGVEVGADVKGRDDFFQC
jgi:hypothetical protein